MHTQPMNKKEVLKTTALALAALTLWTLYFLACGFNHPLSCITK